MEFNSGFKGLIIIIVLIIKSYDLLQLGAVFVAGNRLHFALTLAA